MKLYRTDDGEWVGTQAEAKNKNVIEVPVDKPGLLEWLNDNLRDTDNRTPEGNQDAPVDHISSCSSDARGITAPTPDALANCPRCSFDLGASQRAAQHWVNGAKANALVEFIAKEAAPGQVGEIFDALGERVRG